MLRAWVTEWMFSRVDLQVSGSLNTFILQYFGYYANSNCSGKEKVNEKRNKFIGRHRLWVKFYFIPWGTETSNGNCVNIGLSRSWCISSLLDLITNYFAVSWAHILKMWRLLLFGLNFSETIRESTPRKDWKDCEVCLLCPSLLTVCSLSYTWCIP